MKTFIKSREGTLLILLILLMTAAYFVDPRFLTIRSQLFLSSDFWASAMIAVPMLLIVMTGGIDLSVGSMVAFSAVTLGLLFERHVNIILCCAGSLIAGSILGLVNGWFVAKMKIHPLIVTLATLAVYRGLAEGVSTDRSLSKYPDSFLNLSQGTVFGVPIPAIIFGTIVAVGWFALNKLRLGRWIVATGYGETASLFSGIPVGRLKMLLYGLSGLVCAVAAILMVSHNNSAKADMGVGLELNVLTAVVLGGASIEGGTGNIIGVVLGLILIHESQQFVSWQWQQNELNQIVVGGLLIFTLLVERFVSYRKTVLRRKLHESPAT